MKTCSHYGCDKDAIGTEIRQDGKMPVPGFYPYCENHAPAVLNLEAIPQLIEVVQTLVRRIERDNLHTTHGVSLSAVKDTLKAVIKS